MAPFTPVNPGAFVRRGMFDPTREGDTDSPAGERPLNPADLLALFAGISALGRTHLSSPGFSLPAEASGPSLAQTGAWQSPVDPARQRPALEAVHRHAPRCLSRLRPRQSSHGGHEKVENPA